MKKRQRFQLRLPENINQLKFSDIGNVIGKLPGKFKDYISLKFNRYNQEDTYDDLSCTGSIAQSSTSSMSRGDKLNEPIVYNSGMDTLYNASILSDSASNFPPSVFPPPPPPPPPPAASRRHHQHFDESTVCHYSEFYDQFGNAYTSEIDNGHKFFKKQSAKTGNNKYLNKKQKQFRNHY